MCEIVNSGACVEYRGGCWDLGFKDYVPSAESCSAYCATVPGCAYWQYKALQSNKRCHVCSKDEDWFSPGSCDVAGSCPWGPVQCDADSASAHVSAPQVEIPKSPTTDKNAWAIDLSSFPSTNVWVASLSVLLLVLVVCAVYQKFNSSKCAAYAKVQIDDVEIVTDEGQALNA